MGSTTHPKLASLVPCNSTHTPHQNNNQPDPIKNTLQNWGFLLQLNEHRNFKAQQTIIYVAYSPVHHRICKRRLLALVALCSGYARARLKSLALKFCNYPVPLYAAGFFVFMLGLYAVPDSTHIRTATTPCSTTKGIA